MSKSTNYTTKAKPDILVSTKGNMRQNNTQPSEKYLNNKDQSYQRTAELRPTRKLGRRIRNVEENLHEGHQQRKIKDNAQKHMQEH